MNVFSLLAPPPVLESRKADGTLGIDNIKRITTTVVVAFVDLQKAIKTKDYLGMIRAILGVFQAGNIIAVANEAWEEIKDVTLQESNDIHKHFAEVLDLEDDQAEKLVEYAFGLVPRVYAIAVQGIGVVVNARSLVEETKDVFGGVDATEVDITPLKLAA